MNAMKRKLIFLILFSFIASPSLAIMIGLSTEHLTKASDLIVEGMVEEVKSEWSSDGNTIITKVTIGRSIDIKGREIPEEITLEHDGGVIGDIGLKVSDSPSFEKGEKVIIFIKKSISKKDGTIYNVVGKAQGKYTVGKDGIARKSGFTIVSGTELVDNNIPEGALKDKIRSIK